MGRNLGTKPPSAKVVDTLVFIVGHNFGRSGEVPVDGGPKGFGRRFESSREKGERRIGQRMNLVGIVDEAISGSWFRLVYSHEISR